MPPQLKVSLYWFIALATLAVMIARHVAAGFALPVPWPDEAAFLWQAIAVQRGNTLFAPELNLAREVLWMPPGYMIAIGVAFKILGASFIVARTISFVAVVGAFLAIAFAFRKHSYSIIILICVGWVFCTDPVLVAGNTARMDGMVLFLGACSFALFMEHRMGWGLAVSMIVPLVHPIGIGITLAAIGTATLAQEWRSVLRGWSSRVSLVVVAVAWATYIAHAGGHWTDLQSDIGYQLLIKRANAWPLLRSGNGIFLATCMAVGGYGVVKYGAQSTALLFGAAFWCLYGLGAEAWYECYSGVGAMILVAGVTQRVVFPGRFFRRPRASMGRWIPVGVIILLLGTAGCATYGNWVTHDRSHSGGWYGMHAEQAGVPYMSRADIIAVRGYLAQLQSTGAPVLIQFLPEADAMFFTDMETSTVRMCQGTFYNFTPDIYIVHSSRYIPTWLTVKTDAALEGMHIPRHSAQTILVQRDSTEMVGVLRYVTDARAAE